MTHIHIKSALLGMAGLACVLSPAATPAGAQEHTWKMHITFVPTRPETQMAVAWADRVNSRAGDDLKIDVYPGGALGIKDADMLRILPGGNIIQTTLLYGGYVNREAPEIAYALPNEALSDPADIMKIVDIMNDLYETSFTERGIKYLNYIVTAARGVRVFCKEPFSGLADLQKRKLRVWGKLQADTFAKLGVSGSIIPQSDLYMALQTGVVDCATYTMDAVNTISLYEVAPHGLTISAYAVPEAIIVSGKAWEALKPETQAILQEEADREHDTSIESFITGSVELAEEKKFEEKNGTLGVFPDDDRKAYQEAARAVWLELTETAGGKAKENADLIAKTLFN